MHWNKYQSLGNDFLIAPLSEYENYVGPFTNANLSVWLEPIVRLCNRKIGFGADGVILHNELKNGQVKCLLINSDGSMANFSGNGFACLSAYFDTQQCLVINERFHTSKISDGVELCVRKFGSIKDRYLFEHRLEDYPYSLWDLGNEHAIFLKFADKPSKLLYNDPLESFEELKAGRLESHFCSKELYPEGINVGLAVIGENTIQLRVWERGCGWTEACSSGAVAAFLAANSLRRTVGEVNIMQSGGKSVIYWIKAHESVGLKLNPTHVGSIEYEIKR